MRGALGTGAWLALGIVVFAAAPFAEACSKGCDDASCAAGNRCLDDGSGPACRFPCGDQSACPSGYACTAGADGHTTFCTKLGPAFPAAKGQWGATCNPTGGLDQNPDCDVANGFKCHGASPTDGSAFCTRYDCATDADCAGGYLCTTFNQHPDVTTLQVSHGADATRRACLPRAFCSPCTHDIDCAVVPGPPARCVATAADPAHKFCTVTCTDNGNCAPFAACGSANGISEQVCVPRAGVCLGDGSLCSPCRSDVDCTAGGFCIEAEYTHERYCSSKSATPCTDTTNGCPKPTNGTDATVECESATTDPRIPKDQCIGVVSFGQDAVGATTFTDGCWSKP